MSGETRESISGWTTDTLHDHVMAVIESYDRRYDQRFDAQEHAVEIALAGQVKAVETALAAVDKEFHEHLVQARDEGRLALVATEKALKLRREADERALDIASSEIDKRLEKLNEFRGALSDAQSTMMPRNEALLQTAALEGRIEALAKLISGIGRSVDTMRATLDGRAGGEAATLHAIDRSRNLTFAVLGVVVSVGVFIVSTVIYLATH